MKNPGFSIEDWHLDILKAVKQCAPEIEWNIGGGFAYGLFWNGVYGPPQFPYDIDIRVMREQDAETLLAALKNAHPEIRWAVTPIQGYMQKKYGLKPLTLKEATFAQSLTFRQIGLSLTDYGNLKLTISQAARESLDTGVVRECRKFLCKLNDATRNAEIQAAIGRFYNVSQKYPGLQIGEESLLIEEFRKAYGFYYKPFRSTGDFDSTKAAVQEDEGLAARCTRAQEFSNLTNTQYQIALQVHDFERDKTKEPSPPSMIPPSTLPEGLESLRLKGDKNTKAPPPQGTESWLQHVVFHEPDAVFCEWLGNQMHSRYPFGGSDESLKWLKQPSLETLRKAAGGNSFEGFPQQKPTHDGWPLAKHLIESALQLKTDHILDKFSKTGESNDFVNCLRAAMRLGLLWHDSGKIVNINTPGVHEAIGKKIWNNTKPDWVQTDDNIDNLVRWIIAHHDVYGRLGRGITEKQLDPGEPISLADNRWDPRLTSSYSGALTPKQVVVKLLSINDKLSGNDALSLEEAAVIIGEVWKSDVGSVAKLRWLRDEAVLLQEMVCATPQRG